MLFYLIHITATPVTLRESCSLDIFSTFRLEILPTFQQSLLTQKLKENLYEYLTILWNPDHSSVLWSYWLHSNPQITLDTWKENLVECPDVDNEQSLEHTLPFFSRKSISVPFWECIDQKQKFIRVNSEYCFRLSLLHPIVNVLQISQLTDRAFKYLLTLWYHNFVIFMAF